MKRTLFAAKGVLAAASAAVVTAWAAGGQIAARGAESPDRPQRRQPAGQTGDAFVSPRVPHPGADQIYWVPTFAQAERMARVTGRPIFVVAELNSWDGY